MSLAQRRTTLDGIDPIPSPIPADDDDEDVDIQDSTFDGTTRDRRESAASRTASLSLTVPAEDGKELWKTISYDPFSGHVPQLHHYESFPPELTEHVAAYQVSTFRRVCQVIFAVVACVLASGIVCGFAALKPVLIAEGVYRSLCPADWPTTPGNESQVPCPEQDMRLNLFFITASITLNVSTILAGYVLDNHGRRICYLLAALILLIGSGCMAFAFWMGEKLAQYHVDGYITGNILLGLGGNFLFVSSYQLSNAFPRHAGLVVALVTGAFDASAAVFLFYRLAYEATNHAFRPTYFFLGFGIIIPLMVLVAEFTLMPKSGYNSRRELQAAIAEAQDPDNDIHDSDDEMYANKPQDLRKARQRRAVNREARLEAIETVTGDAAERKADREAAKERRETSGVDGILQKQPVSKQMATAWFWLVLILTVLQMTRMNYFIATVRAQYRYMLGGDEELAERVNSFFDVALPVAGVATTPFIGILLNEVPVWATLGVLTVLIVVLGILNCLGTLWAGYATVVAFVLFRPLYYSAVSDYATKVFGFATFGRIYGTMICASGAGQLIQPALDALTHGPLHNNPVPVNVFFAAAGSLISASLTLFVYTKTRDNDDRKRSSQEDGTHDERRGLLEDSDRRGGGYGGDQGA